MDNIFGVPLSSFLIALTLLVILIFGFLARIWFRNPLLVRMGLRNVVRRKAQTVLIVIGMMLATLIISAAFATGDTVGYSVTNEVYSQFVGADIVVAFDQGEAPPGTTQLTSADMQALAEALDGDENLDGVTGLVQSSVPAINTTDRRAEPRATFAGIDPATVEPFEGLTSPTGEKLDAGALGEDRVYVSESLQDEIGVVAGDRFSIFYEGRQFEFEVLGIVTDNAITSQQSENVAEAASGGFVTTIDRWREITGEQDRIDLIVLSAGGGIRDSLPNVEPLEESVEAYIEASGAPMQVVITKAEFVELAELAGSLFVTLFIVFGLFSIAAGVLLIFLTFIMLAAERRSEMGMARAVGMKRFNLTEMFVAEGMAYNIGSCIIGALLGLLVAFGLVWALSQFAGDLGFDITFHVNPQGLLVAYFLGLVITFITVAFSSWRAANLNIVEAIRDLPDPETFRATDRSAGRLGRATIAVVWSLAWIGLLALWSVAAFIFFTIGLTTYGLGMVAGGVVAAAYVWGVLQINKSWGAMRLPAKVGYVLWWVVFNVMAFVTWILFRTRDWAGRYRNMGGWAVWMLIIGVIATWWGGWPAGQAFAYTAGTTLVIFAIAMLAVYFGARAKIAFSIASLLALWYWLLPLPFSLFIDDADGFTDPLGELAGVFGLPPGEIAGNIEMFFVSGIAMTTAATIFFIFNADRIVGLLNALSLIPGNIRPAMRMAISYPLAARFRTAMTLAMFGLVVFSLVVMATINSNFTQLFLGEDSKGGFDVRVTANASNRIEDLRQALAAADYDADAVIEGVGSLLTDAPQMRPTDSTDDFETYRLQGMDAEFSELAVFPLAARASGYESDEAVFEALRTDPTVAIVDESRTAAPDPFAPQGDDQFRLGPETADLRDQPWDPIPVTVRDPETGAEVEVRVIGVIEARVTGVTVPWRALFVNRSVVEDNFEGGETESFYLTLRESAEPDAVEVASGIEAALLESGVLATSLDQLVDDAAAQSNAFQYLFEGFMGLGLIVGIAALGVIAFRTVAERRQQIGMMRAIGYTRRMIAMTFFLESSFIALAGISMGLILGSALSYNLLTSPELIGEGGSDLSFTLPWARLLLIVGVAYGASAFMTLIPAQSAARVPVAEALRYAG